MAKNKLPASLLLWPASLVYRVAVGVRNYMFDKNILKQHEFDIPIVVVGNISMGGSGKTPHTEYIVAALKHNYHIGVLSRGYKRKTRGFVLATKHSHPDDIGDEPYQLYRKFNGDGIVLAVCEDRVKGIKAMRQAHPEINMIVLDDAFQHRYVKPAVSIVLMESTRPAFRDHMIPMGRLREPLSSLSRADIVVVTKCSDAMRPVDYRIFTTDLNLWPYQQLLFSKYEYQKLVPLFDESQKDIVPQLEHLTERDTVLIVAGVANPKPFIKYLRKFRAKVKLKIYADHHHFTHSDMDDILQKYQNMPGARKIIVTTEKDAVRMMNCPYFPHQLRCCTYYVPIKVKFVQVSGDSRPLELAIEHSLSQKTSINTSIGTI